LDFREKDSYSRNVAETDFGTRKQNCHYQQISGRILNIQEYILGVQLCFRRFPIDGFSGK